MPDEKVFLPFPVERSRVPMATQFRSTWLSSSLRELRARSLMDRYLSALPPEHHDAVLNSVAGVWLDVAVAVAHYEACDRLNLPIAEQIAIGAAVTSQAHGTVLSTLLRVARSAGVGPWTPYGSLNRLWERVWIGGGVGVFKLGEREARIEIVSWPCARVGYCRMAMRGVLQGITELFCKRAVVNEVPMLCGPTSLAHRVQWS